MESSNKIVIIGGGTINWCRTHLALSAPAYGTVARQIESLCRQKFKTGQLMLDLTTMAESRVGGKKLETNNDLSEFVDKLVEDLNVKIVFFPVSVCDYILEIDGEIPSKHSSRLVTDENEEVVARLIKAPKIITKIRKNRKDIFLVGFKQTYGATEDEQYATGLKLCKRSSCNLVLANDTKTKLNMIITPEEARYHVTTNRSEVLEKLVDMTHLRSGLTYVRTNVISDEPIPWNDDVPSTFKKVVEHCIDNNAYKIFNNVTVGHFAFKLGNEIFSSRRKTNYNNIKEVGLTKVKETGELTMDAYGGKPSTGTTSQRMIFAEHPECNCVIHFHCEKKESSIVPVVEQRPYECGSLECAKNTSTGMKKFGNLKAVFLKHHGPNIIFNNNIDPDEVIEFIENNFDLSSKTGGK